LPNSTTGTVSFALDAGSTATVGSWTNEQDKNQSTLVRVVAGWAKVTSGGSITGLTATHPSLTPKVLFAWRVQGAASTPVLVSGGAGTSFAQVTIPSGAKDCAAVTCMAENRPDGTDSPVTWTISGTSSTWVEDTVDEGNNFFGTSGGSAQSNIASVQGISKATTPSAGTYQMASNLPTGAYVGVCIVFQAPASTSTLPVPGVSVLQAVNRASVF
jgi:hypothetical protein